MAETPPRKSKRAKPSFEVPADVSSPPPSGWVFRSEGAPAAAEPPPPAPVTPRATAPPLATAPPRATVPPPGPLRFAWVPLAIAYSTILAMLPQRDRGAR